jgi:hypothetical protein
VRRIIVRTLARDLHLHTDSDEAYAALSFAGADPRLPDGGRPTVDVAVERVGRFHEIAPPGQPATKGSLDAVLDAVFRLRSQWFFEDVRATPVLHAAMAMIAGRCFAFLGDKGFGKTTLMLKLIEDGLEVVGDEHILVGMSGAIARPRRLHVKETSLAVMPSLADTIRASPSTLDWLGTRIFACPPSAWGARWEIREGSIDHLVFVEPNFGGSSIVSPLSVETTFAQLLKSAFMPSGSIGGAAAILRTLAVRSKLWRMQFGDLDQATWHLQKLAASG